MEKKPDILPGTLEYIEDDLRKLTQQREAVSTVMKEQEDELPPLIQVTQFKNISSSLEIVFLAI